MLLFGGRVILHSYALYSITLAITALYSEQIKNEVKICFMILLLQETNTVKLIIIELGKGGLPIRSILAVEYSNA